MNRLYTYLMRDPMDTSNIINILNDTTSLNRQQATEVVKEFLPAFIDIHKRLQGLVAQIDNHGKISDSKLAMYFLNDLSLIEDFVVKKEKGNLVIYYRGSNTPADISEGYNAINQKLLMTIGFSELPYKTISQAIVKAHHWQNSDTGKITVEASIIEAALSFSKLFTIPQLRKSLPSLTMQTSTIEKILLDYGWEFKQYENNKVKYFFRNDKEV